MNVDLPPDLKSGIDRLLEGVSRKDLAQRAARLSDTYRGGGTSHTAIGKTPDGLAYLLARLPATYAAVTASLLAVRQAMPDFAPQTLLDIGAGPGTASWAACRLWPSLKTVTLIDENAPLSTLAETLMQDSDNPALKQARFVKQTLLSAHLPSADLVIASYALGEFTAQAVHVLLPLLWNATEGVLVLVEPGTPDGYANIVTWRDKLLEQGALLAAPCPHQLACPIVPPDWCHFSQRLGRSRDHMAMKGATVPFEDEKFSYIAASRLPVTARPAGRILAPPEVKKSGVVCKVCTDGKIISVIAPRRDREVYKASGKRKWGDAFHSS